MTWKQESFLYLLFLDLLDLIFNQKTIQNEEEFKGVILNGVVFRWKIKNNETVCELKDLTSSWVGAGFKSASVK